MGRKSRTDPNNYMVRIDLNRLDAGRVLDLSTHAKSQTLGSASSPAISQRAPKTQSVTYTNYCLLVQIQSPAQTSPRL